MKQFSPKLSVNKTCYLSRLVQTSLPTWRKGLNFICGLQTEQLNKTSQGSQAVVRPSPEVEALNAAHSIEEDPFWAK